MAISVLFFKENDVWIAYCPSLDLSGYDTTEEKAGEDGTDIEIKESRKMFFCGLDFGSGAVAGWRSACVCG